MLELIAGYGVPVSVFVLMLIAGTEVAVADFARTAKHPRAVLLGAVGQLIMLPPLALLIARATELDPSVANGILVLALCPGGAISNYYSYLARCNVSLSATITGASTICSIVSIPLWVGVLSGMSALSSELEVPAWRMLSQLAAFMVLPMAIGMVLRHLWRDAIERLAKSFRLTSFGIVMAVLALTTWAVKEEIAPLVGQIGFAVVLFIISAMLLGRLMAYGMKQEDAPVLVIESAVRNVGIALIVGRSLISEHLIGAFASFLTGYFIVEMIIVITYTQFVRVKLTAALSEQSL